MSRFFFHRLLILCIGSLLLLSSACKSKKVVVDQTSTAALNGADLLKTVARHQFQANTFDGTARININNESMKVSATATIRMKKDEAIWMSVRKFGFEVGRALVTADSVFVLNRMGNEYVAEPLSYVSETFDLPANLGLLQQLILGNPVYLTTSNPNALLVDDTYLLSATGNDKSNDFRFRLPDYQLEEMSYKQTTEGRNMQVKLSDYKPVGGNRDFAYLRDIEINSSATGAAQLGLTFSRVEINQAVKLTFNVPPNYRRSTY